MLSKHISKVFLLLEAPRIASHICNQGKHTRWLYRWALLRHKGSVKDFQGISSLRFHGQWHQLQWRDLQAGEYLHKKKAQNIFHRTFSPVCVKIGTFLMKIQDIIPYCSMLHLKDLQHYGLCRRRIISRRLSTGSFKGCVDISCLNSPWYEYLTEGLTGTKRIIP